MFGLTLLDRHDGAAARPAEGLPAVGRSLLASPRLAFSCFGRRFFTADCRKLGMLT
jgi:hypothetical protein